WDGDPTGYDHRWLRCDPAGTTCTPIAGATGVAYVLTDADAYHRIGVEVTAENGSGATVARSAPSAIVADAAGRTTQPTGAGQGTDGQAGGTGLGGTAAGAIQGIANPLGQLPGHVANGGGATAHARIAVAFQRADGSAAHRVTLRSGRRIAIVGRL